MNKLEIAPHMLYRAAKSYVEAEDDFDYIQAILLAGSAMYICEPLLEEQGKQTQSMESAQWVIKAREAKFETSDNSVKIEWGVNPLNSSEKKRIISVCRHYDRAIYNALKHAGYKQKKASDDLDMLSVLDEYRDFREAAENIIREAITDYNNLDFTGDFKPYNLPDKIRRVLFCTYFEDAFAEL